MREIYWPEGADGEPTEAWETNDKTEALTRGERERVRVMSSTYTWVADDPVADFTGTAMNDENDGVNVPVPPPLSPGQQDLAARLASPPPVGSPERSYPDLPDPLHRTSKAGAALDPGRFWLDEPGLADLAERYPVDDDHSAFLAIETAILGDGGDQAHAVIQGGCEVAVELLANGDGELDGYRMLIHPSSDLDDPWIAGHVERVTDRIMLPVPTEDGGIFDSAAIIRAAVQAANELLAWSER